MSSALAGTAYLKIDGVSRRLAGEFAYTPTPSAKREPLIGQDGFHGHKETPAIGGMKMKIRDSGDLRVGDLTAIDDGQITVELVNGKTVVGRGMFQIGEAVTVNTEDGTFDIEFAGDVLEA